MEPHTVEMLPLTKVVDIRTMPEEYKLSPALNVEPEISTPLQLGEYICNNKRTFPQDLIPLTEEKTTLRDLNLKHLRLNKAGIKHLCVVLPFVRQIYMADFSDMQLDSEDMESLSAPLSLLVNLEELRFVGNPITEGSKSLARSLEYINQLQILDLTDCYLDGAAMVGLCPGLNHLKHLLLLKLSLNPIGDIGAKALCESLSQMPLIVELELFTCEISNDSASFIEESLVGLFLESVLLGNNKFSAKYEERLKRKFPFIHFGVKQRQCLIF